ncbi:hypothetical protein BDV09DRAFT_161389 [Aspergillus tetrazonus]
MQISFDTHFTLHSCTQLSAFTDGYTESTNDLHWQVPHNFITEIRLEYSSIVAQTGSDAVLFSIFHFITGEALPLFILYTLDTLPFYHFKSILTQHISTSVLFSSCLPDAISSHLSVYFSYIIFLTGASTELDWLVMEGLGSVRRGVLDMTGYMNGRTTLSIGVFGHLLVF